MTALRIITIALIFLLITVASLQAGPPLVTDDASPVDVGKVEIELNGAYTFDKEMQGEVGVKAERHKAEMKLNTGLYKNLGLSLIIPYTFSEVEKEGNQLVRETDGVGDMTLEIKYAFAEFSGISFAIKPFIIIPTGRYSAGLSEGRWQFGTTLIASKYLVEGKYGVHANLGYEHHDYRSDEAMDSNRNELWNASIACEIKVMNGLTAVADVGLASNLDKGSNQLPAYALTGVRYEINDHLDINAGVKLGLTKPEDDLSILYGMVLKF